MTQVIKRTSSRLITITIIKKATTLEILLSQKTSFSLSDHHVGEYLFNDLIAYVLNLVPGLVSEKFKHQGRI